jgi:hypothetical protein
MQQSAPSILLFCLYPASPSSPLPSLSCDDLFLIFSVFSPLKKILIFSKAPVFKAFIEFASPDGSLTCLKELHNKNLDNFGKVKLFSSKLHDLQVGVNFLDFKDFSGVDRTIYLEQVRKKVRVARKQPIFQSNEKSLDISEGLLTIVKEVPEKEEDHSNTTKIFDLQSESSDSDTDKENKSLDVKFFF